mmetsp:Transcript_39747/g.110408  ORF Transcript_39747/g.110408 Transcript_39747/m.110408 type:complete len:216 (-) Transcript_39747:47-694(-)
MEALQRQAVAEQLLDRRSVSAEEDVVQMLRTQGDLHPEQLRPPREGRWSVAPRDVDVPDVMGDVGTPEEHVAVLAATVVQVRLDLHGLEGRLLRPIHEPRGCQRPTCVQLRVEVGVPRQHVGGTVPEQGQESPFLRDDEVVLRVKRSPPPAHGAERVHDVSAEAPGRHQALLRDLEPVRARQAGFVVGAEDPGRLDLVLDGHVCRQGGLRQVVVL